MGESKSSGKCNRSYPPIELTGGNSGAYLFVCTKCYERLSRFEKAKKNVEGIKGRSAAFISPLNTILKTESLTTKSRSTCGPCRKCRTCPRTNYNNKASFNSIIFKVYGHIG